MNKGSTAEERRDSTPDFRLILEQLEPLIRYEVTRSLRGIVPTDVFDLEVDEVIQRVRINLWKRLADHRPIQYPKAYVKRMVHNEVLQLIRRNKPTIPLPLDNDGELFQGNLLSIGTLGGDPAEQVEQIDAATHSLESALDAINTFPRRQRDAMLISLKERTDNILALQEACKVRHIELESFNWPQDQDDKLLLKASLGYARKKLWGILHDLDVIPC